MSAVVVTNTLIAVGELINLLGKAEVYRQMIAKAQAEGRDITSEELAQASARLGTAIEAGEQINAALPDKK